MPSSTTRTRNTALAQRPGDCTQACPFALKLSDHRSDRPGNRSAFALIRAVPSARATANFVSRLLARRIMAEGVSKLVV